MNQAAATQGETVSSTATRGTRGKPSIGYRILPAVLRRLRYVHARVWWPRVAFGRGCDVRSGLYLYTAPGAKASFGSACVIDRGMSLEVFGELLVGNRTIFGHHCTVASQSLVTIGEDCLIAELVSIRDHDHCFDRLDIPTRAQGMTSAPVRIGNNVWIGAKVTIAKGVTIGDNAIIGANAVVTRDIPANAIAMGIPARVTRLRT